MRSSISRRRVAIVAPLQDELAAVLEAFGAPVERINDSPFPQYRGELCFPSGELIETLIFSQSSLGRAHASSLVTFILLTFEVDIIVVVGLCGALRRVDPGTGRTVSLGDVIFADMIIDGEIRKYAGGRIVMKNEAWEVNYGLKKIARQLQSKIDSGCFFSSDNRTNELIASTKMSSHCGPLVSLGSVVADSAISNEISTLVARNFSAPIAVEMEGAGVLTAASIFKASERVMMIRAVNDFANEAKSNMARADACRNAAYVSLEFVRCYYGLTGSQQRNGGLSTSMKKWAGAGILLLLVFVGIAYWLKP